jgi:O-antigen/teichoic acid export membrane protein
VVGSYAALSTVAQLVQIWPLASSQTLGPTVSRYFHAGDLAGVRKALNDYIGVASIVSAFLFAGVATFGDRLDLVFGKSFVFHSDIAFLMSLGYMLSGTLAPIGYSLSMTGRHRAELAILASGGAFLIVTCYALVPLYGAIGAATSVCLTFVLINVTRFVYVSRTLGFLPGKLIDLAPPFIALICAFAAKKAMEAVLPLSFFEVLAACVLYAALNGSAVFAFVLGPVQRRKILTFAR